MNARIGKWISSVLALAVGVTLCVMWKRQDILSLIIYLIGGLFLLTGLINLLVATRRRRKKVAGSGSTFIGTTSGIGGMCIGAAMLLLPAFFEGVIVYALAVVLILAYGFSPIKFPGWFYILPIVVIVEGVVILCAGNVRSSADIVVLMTGIGIAIHGVNSMLELGAAKILNKKMITVSSSSPDYEEEAQEVKAEEM